MDIKELESFKLEDAVTFHDTLNPKLFLHNKLIPLVEKQLRVIAEDFVVEMGLNSNTIEDITISGSNAAFSYTEHSDLDLHILVDMTKISNDEVYSELFHAKKTLYNQTHDLFIHKIPVELYIQDASKPVKSIGEYSVLNNQWIRIPSKRRANFDQTATAAKFDKLAELADLALKSSDTNKIAHVLKTIHRYRQSGLDKGGEFGPENLAYKALRTQGVITQLYAHRDNLHSKRLSVEGQYSTVKENSGYIPSESEKNDSRWKTALSVDVNPYTLKKSAKKFGWDIKRDGRPPILR